MIEINVRVNYDYAAKKENGDIIDGYVNDDADIMDDIINAIESAGYKVGCVNETDLIQTGYFIPVEIDNYNEIGEKEIVFPEYVEGYTFEGEDEEC